MQIVTIDNCERWRVDSHGNGWAYEVHHKPSGRSFWLQDSDATEWRANYEAMQNTSNQPDSAYYGLPWSDKLDIICLDYLGDS
jgi:hypothetical protein